MEDEARLKNMPAPELAEVLDIVLWDMSGDHPAELWLDELKVRPDAATQPVQAAMAVIEEYLVATSGFSL
ncbi:hypothetical protein [Paraburkholderia tropica]|uniref:hypothetical protein n=1 Tax=Paraburkholderia tropica TaxID=92647 RepID=UPI0007FD188F|nr:hypothetical protein [Paraburkholderia tropica]OBR54723.1 hypothetical protein A6456_37945 [Paraburkholderia tropica]